MKLVQQIACDPESSVWISASAGTGKTKILIDRLLSLLINGVDIRKILCLTYTRAAASEMYDRLVQISQKWAIADLNLLKIELQGLLGRYPTEHEIEDARNIFINIIDNYNSVNIKTIHSFCKTLLERYGVDDSNNLISTKFIKPTESNRILTYICTVLSTREDITSYFLNKLSIWEFKDLCSDIIRQQLDLQNFWDVVGINNIEEFFYKICGIEQNINMDHMINEFCNYNLFAQEHIEILLNSSVAMDQKLGEVIGWWYSMNVELRLGCYKKYNKIFITGDNKPRVKLLSKNLSIKYPEISEYIKQEQNRVLDYYERLAKWQTCYTSILFHKFAQNVLALYKNEKSRLGVIDYDDLLKNTMDLLTNHSSRFAILDILDSKISHILIDEAQDSSLLQWQLINSLCAEFFAGESRHETIPTLFVVGDEKQSIYSFQGAQPILFNAMSKLYASKAMEANMKFHHIHLDTSFRSTPPILQLVDYLCQNDREFQTSVSFAEKINLHQAVRDESGYVELWPLFIDNDSKLYEPTIPIISANDKANIVLAEHIASRIQGWLINGTILEAKKRPIKPGDIMILVRHRDNFSKELVRQLVKYNVPTSGMDRIAFTEHIAVMDLIVLGHWAVMPEDDFALAIILRSPIIGCSEEELFELSYKRGAVSLWERIKLLAESNSKINQYKILLEKILNYENKFLPNSFYNYVLDNLGLYDAIIKHMGEEAIEPINELRNYVYLYETEEYGSLASFITDVSGVNPEIVRDMQSQDNKVRIMTVHGAKGLQSPIVILADTTSLPSNSNKIIWETREDMNIPWYQGDINLGLDEVKEENRLTILKEYYRLLYVALTRAEDNLIIVGAQSNEKINEDCWYAKIYKAMSKIAHPKEFNCVANVRFGDKYSYIMNN